MAGLRDESNQERRMNSWLQGSRLWWLAAAAAALVLVLNFWCQLHGSVNGLGPVDFAISLPWALKAALGWLIASLALDRYAAPVLQSSAAARHPWPTRATFVAGVLAITLGNEYLLIRGDAPFGLWLYQRLPLHLLFAALLVAGHLLLLARRLARRTPHEPPAAEASAALVEVMTGTGRTQVRIEDIECLEADRNYVSVHTSQRSYLLRQTLSSLEKSLGERDFKRVHRSVIVNRAKIRERRRGGVLVLSSGRTVRISRAFADRVN
jgi:hypothetical protein